jgi:hypothetical protein
MTLPLSRPSVRLQCHYTFLDECTPAGLNVIAPLCTDPPGVDSPRYRDSAGGKVFRCPLVSTRGHKSRRSGRRARGRPFGLGVTSRIEAELSFYTLPQVQLVSSMGQGGGKRRSGV